MKDRSDLFGPAAAVLLLLLAGWGNAIAMATVGAIASVVMGAMLVLRRETSRLAVAMIMLTSFTAAAAVAFFLSQ